MELLKTSILWAIRILVAALLSSFLHAENVIPCSQQGLSLKQRWDWAEQEARRRNFEHGYWVAYSIDRLMGNREFFISGTRMSFDSVRQNGRTSLSEILVGKREPGEPEESNDQKVKRVAKEALDGINHQQTYEKKVLKGIAILFEFRGNDFSVPAGVEMLNMSLSTDLQNRPVIWLGKAEDSESLSLMQQLYPACADHVKDDLLDGISAHQNPALAFAFLQQVLLSDAPDQLRSTAASAIGDIQTEQSVALLLSVCRKDQSNRVREDAVDALGESSLPSARAGLMEMAKSGPSRRLREKALDRVVEDASSRELKEIRGIILNDPDREIQKRALYALADQENSTPALIEVARIHKDPELKKAAVYALADNASDDAIAALNQVALNDADEELQKAALFALGDLDDGKGIPYVAEIARKHANKNVRAIAIQVLGDSDSAQAKAALRKLLEE